MIDPTVVDTHKFVLTKTKFGTAVAQDMRYTVNQDEFFLGQAMHRLETYVLTEHLATDRYVGERMFHTPATSWQMFKWEHAESWWLGWLVKRKPVQFAEQPHHVVVEVERKALYPQANIAVPELGRPVIFETLTEMENQ